MARKRDNRRNKGQRKRKISDLIWEFGGDFIRMAETVEDRKSPLNAVCVLPQSELENPVV